MSIVDGWETETPLEAGVNALSWARQAEQIVAEQRRAVTPEGSTTHRVPGASQSRPYGPRVAPRRRSTPGEKPLGPLAGNGLHARVAREPGRTPVVVSIPFRDLPVGGWSGYGNGSWTPEDQPQAPLLYPSAHNVDLVNDRSFDNNTPTPTGRPFSIGLLDKPESAPATPRGTEALTVATSSLRLLAAYLGAYAEISPMGEKRRYRAEADAYTAHARACESAILSSLAWLPEVEQQLEPVPPFAPILIPAQLRGFIAVGPY